MVRPFIHIALHFIVPAVVARFFFADRWKWAWLIMVLTMAVDTDHLLATPVYDPERCGIGFHPLHSYPAIIGWSNKKSGRAHCLEEASLRGRVAAVHHEYTIKLGRKRVASRFMPNHRA